MKHSNRALDMVYWAHSDSSGCAPDAPGAEWQPLSEHLVNVSDLAFRLAEFALPTNPHFHEMAEYCGLLHDFGKYSDDFQNMIRTSKGKCQHAVHGATLSPFGTQSATTAPNLIQAAAAIAGHHPGVPSLTGGGKSLAEKTRKFRGSGPRRKCDC